MIKYLACLFVGSILTSFGYAQNKMSVTGYVLDANTRTPISGVRVYTKGDTTVKTVSDAKGGFRLSIPEKTDVYLMAKNYKHFLIAYDTIKNTNNVYLRKSNEKQYPPSKLTGADGSDMTSMINKQTVNKIYLPPDEWDCINGKLIKNVTRYKSKDGHIWMDFEY